MSSTAQGDGVPATARRDAERRDQPVDDLWLLSALAARDLQALTVLCDRYAPGVYAQARRLNDAQTAQQITVRTFQTIWARIGSRTPHRALGDELLAETRHQIADAWADAPGC